MKIILYLVIFLLIIVLVSYNTKNSVNLKGKIKDDFFHSGKEKKLNFLWSKGLEEKNNYMLIETEKISENQIILDQIKNNVVWIRLGSFEKENLCDLDIFSESLEKLNREIILVTSDGDKSVPSEIKLETYEKIINHPMIKSWYTQNYDGTSKNQKLKHYPIGFDLHTDRYFFGVSLPFLPKKPVIEKINLLLQLRKNNKNKIRKIFCDVHLSCNKKFNNERKRVKEILEKSDNVNFLNLRTSQENIWKKYTNHKFVVSTHGNGLDCHRTWEIIFLGGIVITKKSSLDPMFEGLPVVIVNDWEECKNSENLKIWDEIYTPLTNDKNINKYFLYDHWIK